MKRLAVFAHFDYEDLVDDYVVFYLNELKKVVNDIIFISTSKLSDDELKKMSRICLITKCRENIGYDFFSYKEGLMYCGVDYKEYDEVVLCNDSIYGPMGSFEDLFKSMSDKRYDVWSLTQSNEIEKHMSLFQNPRTK